VRSDPAGRVRHLEGLRSSCAIRRIICEDRLRTGRECNFRGATGIWMSRPTNYGRISIMKLLLVAAVAGCGEVHPPERPAIAKAIANSFTLQIVFLGPVDVPVRVYADGRQIGDLVARDVIWLNFNAASDAPTIHATAHLPCGWRDVRFFDTNRELKKPTSGNPGKIFLQARLPVDLFIVDNRDGLDTTLVLGELSRVIPGGQPVRVNSPRPDCQAGAEMRLGANVLGSLPTPPEESTAGRAILVDPTAKRCYRYSTARYSRLPQVAATGDTPINLRRATLHVLPGDPDHLFRHAPSAIQSHSHVEVMRQLLDVPC